MQIASTQHGWMQAWWTKNLIEAETKNEFHLIHEGVPVAYKWDLPTLPVWVKAHSEAGALQVVISNVRWEDDALLIDNPGIWLVTTADAVAPATPGPQLPTPEAPPPLTEVPRSITFYGAGYCGIPFAYWHRVSTDLICVIDRETFVRAFQDFVKSLTIWTRP